MMSEFRVRLLAARGLLLLACAVALTVLPQAWVIQDLGEITGMGGPPMKMTAETSFAWCCRMRVETVGKSGLLIDPERMWAAMFLLVMALLFLGLVTSPWLARVYSRAGMILWLMRGMASGLAVLVLWDMPLMLQGMVMPGSYGVSAGDGMWTLGAAAATHALGLWMIPRDRGPWAREEQADAGA